MRTTTIAVQALLETGVDYDTKRAPDLTVFAETASAFVDRVAACATGKGFTHTATELELLERWIAAHFYKSSDQAFASRSTQGKSGSFQGQTAMNLDGTKYGQQAQVLDTSGCTTALSKRQSARALWLGKPASEQIPWQERD